MPLKKHINSYGQLYRRAEECFGDNLLRLGVGGSGFQGKDIDSVVVLRKLDFDQIKTFVNSRISVIPLTELMYKNRKMWPDKFITMMLKGLLGKKGLLLSIPHSPNT